MSGHYSVITCPDRDYSARLFPSQVSKRADLHGGRTRLGGTTLRFFREFFLDRAKRIAQRAVSGCTKYKHQKHLLEVLDFAGRNSAFFERVFGTARWFWYSASFSATSASAELPQGSAATSAIYIPDRPRAVGHSC